MGFGNPFLHIEALDTGSRSLPWPETFWKWETKF
jgi:hypothetical protein